MKKKLIVVAIFSLGLMAWNLYPSKYEQLMKPAIEAKNKDPNITIDGELEPPFPDKKENDKTILGVDVNNNGVRDDVEIWINRTFVHADQRKALKEYAKSYTKELIEAPKLYKKLAFDLRQESEARTDCLMRVFMAHGSDEFPLHASRLRLVILDPDFRKKASFLQHNLLAGQMIGGLEPSNESPYKYCKFDVQKKQAVLGE